MPSWRPSSPSFLFLHGMLSEQLQRHIWIWASAANVRSKCGFVPCCLGSSVVFERLWSQLLDLSRCWVRSMRPDMYKTWYKTTWYFGMVNFIDFKTFQKWNDFGSRSHASKRYWITCIYIYMCWMLINWKKKRIFELFWTLEMKFSSLWSLQTRILGGLDLGMSCSGACVPVSSNSDGGDLANFRPLGLLGLLGGYGLIALCKISVGKSTVSPVATHSQKCQWISWMDDGNLAPLHSRDTTIPSSFPCI